MPTMIRPKLTFTANNAAATPQNARSLSGSSLLGRIDRLVKRTEDLLPGHDSERAPGAPGCRERGGKRTLCTRPTIEGQDGCPGPAQRQQKTRFVRTA